MTLSTSAVAVCCCRRFAQLVEQPHVLDGDDGLIGEILDQLDLLVGERSNLLAVDDDRRRSDSFSLSIGTATTVLIASEFDASADQIVLPMSGSVARCRQCEPADWS